MVALTKSQLLHHANYFGKRSVRGSTRKAVIIKGAGLYPLGSGITTFGTGIGNGMSIVTGGSIFSKIKELASPLLKRGTKALVQTAKTALSSQIDKIKDPKFKALAEAGLKTGEQLVDKALTGNKNLSAYTDILKSNLAENSGLAKDVAQQQAMQMLSKAVRGRPKKASAKGVGGGKTIQNTVAAVTDRKMKPNTLDMTTDNRQLTILKDIVRSRPIKPMGRTKGNGLSTF